ncbi:unnamed protein product, partial [Meganyctiphanes norvegica]
MHASQITVNNQSVVENSSGTPTGHVATEDYRNRAPVNLNQIFVSRISRTLSLDSSIPVMPSMNKSDKVSFVPMSSVQQITKKKSISRLNSGASKDLYFP